MKIPRVGKEISATEYWIERSDSYPSNIDGPYHAHRLAMVDALLAGVQLASKTVLDVGCGDGVMLARVARRGAHVVGFDLAPPLVQLARNRLSDGGLDGHVFLGGMEAMVDMPHCSADVVLCLNVMAYCTDAEEELFYRETSRILKVGGSLIVTHSNELFDMYTLNAYTVAFYEAYLTGEGSGKRVASLLTHTDAPTKPSFNVRANPLNYRFRLAEFGLEEVQQEFANLHPIPPLLMDAGGFQDIDSRAYRDTLGWDVRDRWRLLFLCSMYGSRSVKTHC